MTAVDVDQRSRHDRLVPVQGVDTWVSVEGDGPPLLLIMGIGGNVEMWKPLRAALTGFRTIAFDVPGTGRSPVAAGPMSMAMLADLAIGVLDELGVDRAHVLGYSFGGAVAQELAYRHPARVERLVLATTMCGWGAVTGHPLTLLLMATPLRYYSAPFFRAVAPILYGGRMRRSPELVRREVDARVHQPPSLAGYTQQLLAISCWSSLGWLHKLEAPTLVLMAGDDPLVPAYNGLLLAQRIPRCRLEIVPNAGHLLLLDSADEVAPTIGEFLRRPDVVVRSDASIT